MDNIYKVAFIMCMAVVSILCLVTGSALKTVNTLTDDMASIKRELNDDEQIISILQEEVEIQREVFSSYLNDTLSKDVGGE